VALNGSPVSAAVCRLAHWFVHSAFYVHWSAKVLLAQGMVQHCQAHAYSGSNHQWHLGGSVMDHSDFRQLLFQCSPPIREAVLRRTRLSVFTLLTGVWKCSRRRTCACVSCRVDVQGRVRNGQATSLCNLAPCPQQPHKLWVLGLVRERWRILLFSENIG